MKKLTVLTIFAVIVSVLLTACTFGTYSVTLDYGYGEPTVTTVDGGSVFILPEAERDGYDFLGWKSEGGYRMMQAGEKVTVTSDVTYKAYWVIEGGLPEPPPETVKIVLKDGDEVVATETVVKGAEFVVPDCDVIHEGKDFAGWSSEDLNYNPGDKFVADKNCVLTAQWADKILTVTFKDGNSVYKTEEITYGSELTVPECDAEHLGKRFSGWKLGEVAYNAGNKLIVKENCEFSAVWVDIEYIIRFIDNDGTVLKTETLLYGDMPTAPEAGDKTESETTVLVFSGWDAEIVAVTANKDYTATYIPTTRYYPVSFLGGDFVRFTDTEGAEITEISREYNEPYYFCVVKNAGVDISGMRVSVDGVEVSAQDGIYTAVFSENTVVSVEGAVKIEYFLNFNSENATYTAEMPDEVVYGSTVKVLARGNEWYEDAAPAVTYAGSEIVSCGTEVADDVTYFVYEITVTRNGVISISGVEDVIPVTFVDLNKNEIAVDWHISLGPIGLLYDELGSSVYNHYLDGTDEIYCLDYRLSSKWGKSYVPFTTEVLDSYLLSDSAQIEPYMGSTDGDNPVYPIKGSEENVYYLVYYYVGTSFYSVSFTAPEGVTDLRYYVEGTESWSYDIYKGVGSISSAYYLTDSLNNYAIFGSEQVVYITFNINGDYPILHDFSNQVNYSVGTYDILGEEVICYRIEVGRKNAVYYFESNLYTVTITPYDAVLFSPSNYSGAIQVVEGGSISLSSYVYKDKTNIMEYLKSDGATMNVNYTFIDPEKPAFAIVGDAESSYSITAMFDFMTSVMVGININNIKSDINIEIYYTANVTDVVPETQDIPYRIDSRYDLYINDVLVEGEVGSIVYPTFNPGAQCKIVAKDGYVFIGFESKYGYYYDDNGTETFFSTNLKVSEDHTTANFEIVENWNGAYPVIDTKPMEFIGIEIGKYLVSHDEFNCATSDTLNGIAYVEEPKAYIGEDGVFSFKVKLPYGNTPVLYVEYASRPSDGSVKYYPVETSHEGTVTSTFTFTVSGVDSDIGWFIKLVPNVYEVTVNYGDVTEVIELAHGTELEGCDLLPEYFEGYKDDVAGKFTVIGWATKEDAAEPDIISISGPVTIWAVTEFEPYV